MQKVWILQQNAEKLASKAAGVIFLKELKEHDKNMLLDGRARNMANYIANAVAKLEEAEEVLSAASS